MGHETFLFKGINEKDVFVRCWNTDTLPLGVLQVFHGMAEHSERYGDLAGYLNTIGIAVYACDQRGHGKTGEMDNSSCHLDNDGFNGILEDQKKLTEIIKEKHPGIPLFILGHSFGSFVAQEYIKRYGGGISGVILSGSCMMNGIDVKVGYFIALMSLALGRRRPNSLINMLSFGSYNKAVESPSSKFSWLSRDEAQVRLYDEDKYCGCIMSTNFYYYFFKGLNRLYKTEGVGKIPKDLPVYIMSGEKDPVGNYGKGAEKLYKWYESLGLQDLQLKLYKDGRHEMINEINRREVYHDIAVWLTKHA